MDFAKVFGSISLTNPSWDLFVLVIFLSGVYLFMFRYGKNRAFLVLLSSYVSLALVEKLSLIKQVTGLVLPETFINKTVLFLVGIFVSFLIFYRSDFVSIFNRGLKGARFQVLVVSFLTIGMIISLVASFLSPAEAENLSIFLKTFFVDDRAQLFWLISPFFAVALIKEK